MLDEFYKLNYKKVFFSHKNYPLDDLVYIKESDKQNMVLDLTKYSNCNGEKYYEKYFDFNKWINTGLPTASCLKGKNRLTLYVVTDNESEYLPVGRVFIGVKNKKIRNVLIYDDNQDNISSKNSYFYELTALYWIWKNDKVSKIIGLEQNNRFFGAKSFMSIHSPLKYEKVYKILSKYDVIGSKNACFNNRYDNQYAKYLEDCRKVISEIYPNYDKSFSKIINYNVAYRYNMFIMSKLNLDRYCEWLFKILFTLEKRIGIKNDNNQEHIFCYLSEKLFNVWIYHNKIKVYESPTYMYN